MIPLLLGLFVVLCISALVLSLLRAARSEPEEEMRDDAAG